jgi:hypothetical protein
VSNFYQIKVILITALLIFSGTANVFSSSSYLQNSIVSCSLSAESNVSDNQHPDYWEGRESQPDKNCHLTQVPEIPVPAAIDSKIRMVSRMKLQVLLYKKVYSSCISIYQFCLFDQKNITPLLNILQI